MAKKHKSNMFFILIMCLISYYFNVIKYRNVRHRVYR